MKKQPTRAQGNSNRNTPTTSSLKHGHGGFHRRLGASHPQRRGQALRCAPPRGQHGAALLPTPLRRPPSLLPRPGRFPKGGGCSGSIPDPPRRAACGTSSPSSAPGRRRRGARRRAAPRRPLGLPRCPPTWLRPAPPAPAATRRRAGPAGG